MGQAQKGYKRKKNELRHAMAFPTAADTLSKRGVTFRGAWLSSRWIACSGWPSMKYRPSRATSHFHPASVSLRQIQGVSTLTPIFPGVSAKMATRH
jgi:hypothetical protein